MRRFTRAYEAGDVREVVTLLTEDAWLVMPPVPMQYQGRELAARFWGATAFRPGRSARLVPTRANGQPAFGLYVREPHTSPGARWAAGSQTHIPYTRRNRRSAKRSFATPFCAQMTGRSWPAVPPPATGLPGPLGEHGDGVLRLGGHHEDVARAEVDLGRPADRGGRDRVRARVGAQPEPVTAQRSGVTARTSSDRLHSSR